MKRFFTSLPVIKVRMTTERWQEGCRETTSRSKWIGMRMTGICEMLPLQPLVARIDVATWSASRIWASTLGVRNVGVMSVTEGARKREKKVRKKEIRKTFNKQTNQV